MWWAVGVENDANSLPNRGSERTVPDASTSDDGSAEFSSESKTGPEGCRNGGGGGSPLA